ncbi:MAG: molybdopterin-guanine dinucleotide biosynthesis protein B [Clostridium sp.]
MIPMISIVGFSNSGKTTLLEKIILELKSLDYRVGVIKHNHCSFNIDHEGKDTYRHAKAGADTVIIASSTKVATVKKVQVEPSLDEIAAGITDVDIIFTEGYKRGNKPKIEVFRKELNRDELFCCEEELLAVASNHEFNINVPCYHIDDIRGLTTLIIDKYLRPQNKHNLRIV